MKKNNSSQLSINSVWAFAIVGLALMLLVIIFRQDVGDFSAGLRSSHSQLAAGSPVPDEILAEITEDPRNISPESFFNSPFSEAINSGIEALFIAQE